jgi:hypothetical protein
MTSPWNTTASASLIERKLDLSGGLTLFVSGGPFDPRVRPRSRDGERCHNGSVRYAAQAAALVSTPGFEGLNALSARLDDAVKRFELRAARPHGGFRTWAAVAARIGYGARGFVYLSIGLLALAAALGVGGDTIGSQGVAPWLAEQPFGRVWLVLLGLGLWAFVL